MQMALLTIPLALLVASSWVLIRGRGMRARAVSDGAAVALLTFTLWCAHVSPLLLRAGAMHGAGDAYVRVIAIMWWTAAARLAAVAARALLEHDLLSREARITADLVSGTLYLATVLVVANFVLKLPIGGLLATSGVVAVVLGLALQNTLADVFSGIAVGLEQPFGAGDRITVPNGVEGVVVEMNWRSIRVQTDDEDIATLPNSVIAKAQVVNRSSPFRRRLGQVVLSCPATAAPEVVLEILRRSAMLCLEILDRPLPRASMTRLGIRTATYTLDFFVPDSAMVADSKTALLAHAQRQLRYTGILRDGDDESRPCAATPDMLINDLPVFASLSCERRQTIARRMRRMTLGTADVLFAKDGEVDGLYVVAAGIVEMTGTAADVPSPSLRRVGPGDTLGDVGLLAGGRRLYTARALTSCVLFVLERGDLLQLIEEDGGLMLAIEQSAREHLAILESALTSNMDLTPPGSHLLQLVKRLIWNRAESAPGRMSASVSG